MEVHIVILEYKSEDDSGTDILGLRKDYECAKQLIKEHLNNAKLGYCCDHLFDENGNLLKEYVNDPNIICDINDERIYIADHWRCNYVNVNIITAEII